MYPYCVIPLSLVLEKIDEQEGFKLFGTTDSREPENAVEILEQREQKVLFHESTELGRASNLRKSLDWDTAFFTSAVVLEKIDEQEGFKLFGTTDSREPENAVEILEQREQKVLFHESIELGRASNLRKSLDWDTAFFTSAGLLDPEELFIINKGFEKVEAHLLPITQEDLCTRRYADSESTLDSDDFSLDSNQSTEVDLFEEIRAPIEKSNIMSNICKSVCKSGVGEADKRETHSLKKLDDISRNRVKSTPTSRRQSVYMQGSKRVKEVVHPQIDAKKNMVSVGQRKKISLRADHVKMGNKVATLGSGEDFIVSKKSGLGNSCCSTSSTTSLESSSSVSVTTSNDSSASCSPSGSASSLKSSSNSRRKADSKKSRLAASSVEQGVLQDLDLLICWPRGLSYVGRMPLL
ncbi:hypothetical protein TEA_018446 [Camellia sinensis var. sinensis]|uniref:Uncharacterized protein n=1 Tax=Camellia sinensis var. sinensis TaxID=542762 RepID=A0A4S4D8P6_CAMSN|nr:hypothetical protein TEA_018446 [Camellia sinensis var. sinensis]